MRFVKRVLLTAISLTVVLYAAGVLHRVRSTSDLGLHCLITPDRRAVEVSGAEVGRVDMDVDCRLDPLKPGVGPVPQQGSMVLRVGGRRVPTFLHFQQRLGELQASQLALVLADEEGLRYVAGQWWVEVEFADGMENGPQGPQPRIERTWLRLKPAPLRRVVASAVWFVLELISLAIGALVVTKRPGDLAARLFFALCAVSVVTFMGAFHWSEIAASLWLLYPFVLCGVSLAPLMLHFLLVFPRPAAALVRWPRLSPGVLYGVAGLWAAGLMTNLIQIYWLFLRSASTADLSQVLTRLTWWIYSYLAAALVMIVAGHWSLVYGYLHSRTVGERRQAKWILSGVVLSALPMAYLLFTATSDRGDFAYGPASQAAIYLMTMLFTLSYAISITRYKLFQVGRLASRGIVYVAISFAASVVFCLLVGLATAVVGRYYFSWENALAVGLTTMLVVSSLGWIRDRFQQALDRRFYREKYQLDKALDRLGRAVDQLIEPAELAQRMAESAQLAVGAGGSAVFLRDAPGGRFERAVAQGLPRVPAALDAESDWGREVCRHGVLLARGGWAAGTPAVEQQLRAWGGEVAIALEQDGEAVGFVVLGPKEDQQPYSDEDRNFLLALARTASLALHSAQSHRAIETLREDLQAKLGTIARQRQQIRYLQGELMSRGEAAGDRADGDETATTAGAERLGRLEQAIRGSSPAVRHLLAGVAKIAASPSSVLIRGESGTGKGLLAAAIHGASPRAAGPFVSVHCAALSPSLLESELFGHVKGAFTGADRDKPGRFELADEGTLFLDEIGDVSLEIQTKLLRVLQERSFERVGDGRTRQVDVRLIAATHQNLEGLISSGRFREDLYFRLNVISVWCPALRERREDVLELALHFLERLARRAGKRIVRFSDGALDALTNFDWPGNIRQLENAVERAVVLAESDVIRREDLPPEILVARRPNSAEIALATTIATPPRLALTNPGSDGAPLDVEYDERERTRLLAAIQRAKGNKARAARDLGLPRSTLFSKLRRLGIE